MEVKYLVICVNDSDICSVDVYDSEKDANDALANDAQMTYDEIEEHPLSSIEVSPGKAKVIDGIDAWGWSLYPLRVR